MIKLCKDIIIQYVRSVVRLNQLAQMVHETAKAKGWYDQERSALEMHMLIVSELAEATQAVRKDYPSVFAHDQNKNTVVEIEKIKNLALKPEGEAVELADALIRIADYFAYRGWDLEKTVHLKLNYNDSRPYRHGGMTY